MNKAVARVVMLSLATIAAGCLSQNAGIPQSNVVEADERMVANCTFLGTVQGVAMWSNGAQHEIKRTIGSAKKEAEKLGATHVVLGEPQFVGRSRQISGRAYRCSQAMPQS